MARDRAIRWTAALAIAIAVGSSSAGAQTVVLDEGTFEISVDGRVVGTESFTIRREGAGEGASILANATVTLDLNGRSLMRTVVKTNVDGAPVEYSNAIEGQDVSAVSLRHMGRHFRVQISSEAGERERELPVRDGSVLLESGVAHHYWFLGDDAHRQGTTVTALEPKSGQQLRIAVASVSPETISVAGERVSARKVTLSAGEETRSVWFDERGRLLRVEVPATGYRAVRAGG